MTTSRQHVPRPSIRRRRRRVLLQLTAGFVVAVLAGASAAAGMVHWGFASITRSTVAGLTTDSAAAKPAASAETGPRLLNVLVVGNDSREGLTPEQIREFGTGEAEGNRTDTIMLVQLELDGEGRGAVLSFPRDLLVSRCDGSRGRINAAYGIGLERDGDGPSCVVETVTNVTGVDIHHYVEVSFAGFLKVVDAIGGVGLYLDEPLRDAKAHIDLPAGCVRLEGRDALGFVRARHLDNDFGRIARQQRFIKETLREATDIGVVSNPSRLLRVIDAAASSVHTDDTLGVAQMRSIALGMRRLTADGLAVHTVPGRAVVSGGTWYVDEHHRKARSLYAAFRDGSIVRKRPAAPSEAATPLLPAVTVLNAAGADGVAAAAAELVAAAGFPVAEVGDADAGGLAQTRILHPPELAAPAERLAGLFDDAHVIQGVAGLPLTVKLGADITAADIAGKVQQIDGASSAAHPEKRRASTPEPTYRGARMTDVDC